METTITTQTLTTNVANVVKRNNIVEVRQGARHHILRGFRLTKTSSTVTISASNIPAYASACSGASAYSSACSCIGATQSKQLDSPPAKATLTETNRHHHRRHPTHQHDHLHYEHFHFYNNRTGPVLFIGKREKLRFGCL